MNKLWVIALAAAFAARADDGEECSWTQWGRTAAHGGQVCRDGQRAQEVLASFTFDPFVAQEQADDPTGRGDLLAHYPAPLLDGDAVYMLSKSGSWTACNPPGSGGPQPCGVFAWSSQVWSEKRYRWRGNTLAEEWTFTSDWKPMPARLVAGWEPVFQAALGDGVIYIPGAGGTVHVVDRKSGAERSRINPFGDAILSDHFVSGGITVTSRGELYWNVIQVNPQTPFRFDAQAWLVKVDRRGKVSTVSYTNLIPGAPAATDSCFTNFFNDPNATFPLPPPNNPDGSPALPPAFRCGTQRPGANVTPAVGEDGTIFTVSHSHFNANYAYVVALNSDLTLKWAASMRDRISDGCGVLVPYDDNSVACRTGATPGVDPFTNLPPAGGVIEQSSSSPVALPDGGVLYGAFTNYNEARGHLFKFDATGNFAGSYDFGWDLTPGVWRHDGTYSIVLKDNHYGTNGPYYITQLNASLSPEWRYKSVSTESCSRNPDGSVTCVDTGENPDGFEWCINAPAVDPSGNVYALSEDGNFYKIGQGGGLREQVFLNQALGAAYTPIALDARGRIYALNNGTLTVLGSREESDD